MHIVAVGFNLLFLPRQAEDPILGDRRGVGSTECLRLACKECLSSERGGYYARWRRTGAAFHRGPNEEASAFLVRWTGVMIFV